MKTYAQVKNEVLGLMFSNINDNQLISTEDESVKEYTLNMPDAFNSAIREIAIYYPKKDETQVKSEKDGQLCVDLSENPNFMNTNDISVYVERNSVLSNYMKFFVTETGKVYLKCKTDDIFYIVYNSFYDKFDGVNEQAFLDIPEEVLDAAIYGVASRLFAEDDISLSTQYQNIYENKKQILSQKYKEEVGYIKMTSDEGAFTSEKGWI